MAKKPLKITTIDALVKTLSDIGYSESKKDSQNRVIVYVEGDRKTALKGIAEVLGGKYLPQKSGTGWKSSAGAAQVGQYFIIAKPATKTGAAGSLASLDARTFSGAGKPSKFDFHGEKVPCVTFTDPKDIEKSIIQGCANSNLLGKSIAAAYDEFFKTGKIAWQPKTPAPTINKLGVYTGEVLVGWVFLKKLQSKHFLNNPFKGIAKAFHLPTDPAFSGVDSWIEMKDGSYYSLSSKFGGGAKASIFSNLLEKGIKYRGKLKKSVFKDLCDVTADNNLTYKKSRDIVYIYGVRKILGIGADKIRNPSDVYDQISGRKKGKESDMVIAAIRNYNFAGMPAGTDKLIKDNLPNSVSAFFNRKIADMLNKDAESVKQMKEILQGKDYWQGNLQISNWTKGDMKFKWLSSAEAQLNIIGSKGSASDITSKQGWINYELKY